MKIRQYMAIHQHDPDASELWTFFQQTVTWVEAKFRYTFDNCQVRCRACNFGKGGT